MAVGAVLLLVVLGGVAGLTAAVFPYVVAYLAGLGVG